MTEPMHVPTIDALAEDPLAPAPAKSGPREAS